MWGRARRTRFQVFTPSIRRPRNIFLRSPFAAKHHFRCGTVGRIAAPYPGFTGTVAQALRPFPQYQGIGEFYEKDGHTSYESLQLKAEKRYSSGLTVLAAFTLGKEPGERGLPAERRQLTFWTRRPQDNADYKPLKAYSPNDVPKRFVTSYIYELPFGKGNIFIEGAGQLSAGGDWQDLGIFSYQNNTPLAFTTSLANPLFGGPIRPNVGNGVPFRLRFRATVSILSKTTTSARLHDLTHGVYVRQRRLELQFPWLCPL